MADSHFYGTGKRKTAIARVFLKPGSGKVTINRRSPEEYFPTPARQALVREPLETVDGVDKYDLMITVKGGGLTGQAAAVRHGIARALENSDGELRAALKERGLLRRDARKKERKKYGQRGARARFQFSKR